MRLPRLAEGSADDMRPVRAAPAASDRVEVVARGRVRNVTALVWRLALGRLTAQPGRSMSFILEAMDGS